MKKTILALFLSTCIGLSSVHADNALILQTDFSLKDGAVSAMKGVAFSVDSNLKIFDLTHEIPPYNIWEGAYRLYQTASYWPKGSVFVSVVDPGVGTNRKSVVLKTKNGQYFVSPDNGTLTLVAQTLGIDSVREIDEKANRLKGSEKSYTFHGRDVYAYTGARLASGAITFEQVGPELPAKVVEIPYQKAKATKGEVKGNIPILDIQYGNVWSNISDKLLNQAKIKLNDTLCVTIFKDSKKQYEGKMPYVASFGDVLEGQPLVYLNSLLNVSVALNMDNFAQKHQIKSGADWNIDIKKCAK
ncbi:SAM hydrolase/SAM-dependent halogenase family protein [Helicobacter pylori]|uniref:SAM hydrolase/SAM-dependent halogenase family protein n=1 Tax=Helicobacter pylori TaxID=210 RepID=UPI000FDEA87E|nr:S-adenosyl-l-methionine hydroxide adenosyltransferase family protein [Helicobacter pylori]MBH0308403.1 S-adenosyl-l-methionine hydroxide adenosyltransferase family protein [Helicobacter pylori]NGP56341.1 S-adenosyl-l-methionine hydroxide adenosyltransferase family protein [Helicobacter pylori]RVZ76630.1 acetolactate synthase [Helicobacter pylori]WQZ69393.1 S-adenosyl-l-methionine hydroxide adenosyltransferase family protein [Helicobacter pylori]WRA94611.1 S-adenosyl-l-methionine hydroxide a